jgi:hypothetical protein
MPAILTRMKKHAIRGLCTCNSSGEKLFSQIIEPALNFLQVRIGVLELGFVFARFGWYLSI